MKDFELKKIIAKSKKYIYGELLGEHNSKQIGDGYDFAKIRPYEYGENIRRVDPYASAKTGEIYLRSFYESREVNVEVIALMSGSLFFGTKKLKQEKVAEVISILGLSAIKNSDTFTLSLFSDRLIEKTRPTKKESGVINATAKALHVSVLNEQIDYEKLREYGLNSIKKRSYLFLVGDFLEIPNLKALSAKHEVVVVRVRDAFENDPSIIGEIGIVDPSSGEKADVIFDKRSVEKYKKDLKKADLKFGEYLKDCGIRLIDWKG
ncbi:DUF58 domain-containing protein [Sulfurospirillum arcachonense]|uniref:DUF58 domain-containing protein n=1 Tax=Sulfurospirillum arcachonense TaxID=57666 RepID=UPI00046A951C|nr:DUF58 domain-containing protein [Sulfurospirillum arcachonense]